MMLISDNSQVRNKNFPNEEKIIPTLGTKHSQCVAQRSVKDKEIFVTSFLTGRPKRKGISHAYSSIGSKPWVMTSV